MEEPKMIINTSMSKEDYKKFLYIATFRRNKLVVPLISLLSLLGGVIIGFNNGHFSLTKFIMGWILVFVFTIITILFKIERRNAQRIKTDKTGTFDSINTLEFYNHNIKMKNESIKSTSELRYDQFFSVMESKDYFIFYFTVNQASLIRKKDVEDLKKFKGFIIEKMGDKYKQI